MRRPHGFEMTVQRRCVADQMRAVFPLVYAGWASNARMLIALSQWDLRFKTEAKDMMAHDEMKQS
jgi:hypothetical protein